MVEYSLKCKTADAAAVKRIVLNRYASPAPVALTPVRPSNFLLIAMAFTISNVQA